MVVNKQKVNMFEKLGISERDVRKWAEEKKIEHLPDNALAQLYARVVLKKVLRKPLPIMKVSEIWEKIDRISSGVEEAPSSGKIFCGLKDVTVVGLINSLTYKGCPMCLKGTKTLGSDMYCSNHPEKGVVELENLSWTEWSIYDEDGEEFIIKLNPRFSRQYSENDLTGAVVWVEGNINLDDDQIVFIVNSVLSVEGGNLLGPEGNLPVEEDEERADRTGVEIDGFDDEEDEGSNLFDDDDEYNPFLEDDGETNSINDTKFSFEKELREEMKDVLSKWAVRPVRKAQVTRSMIRWVDKNYSEEIANLDDETLEKLLWDMIDGLYEEVDGKIKYVG